MFTVLLFLCFMIIFPVFLISVVCTLTPKFLKLTFVISYKILRKIMQLSLKVVKKLTTLSEQLINKYYAKVSEKSKGYYPVLLEKLEILKENIKKRKVSIEDIEEIDNSDIEEIFNTESIMQRSIEFEEGFENYYISEETYSINDDNVLEVDFEGKKRAKG